MWMGRKGVGKTECVVEHHTIGFVSLGKEVGIVFGHLAFEDKGADKGGLICRTDGESVFFVVDTECAVAILQVVVKCL